MQYHVFTSRQYSSRRINLHFSSWGVNKGLKLDLGSLWPGEGAVRCGQVKVRWMHSSSCRESWTSVFGIERGGQWFAGQLEHKCIAMCMDCYLDAWSMLSEAYCSREAPAQGQIPASSSTIASLPEWLTLELTGKEFLGWKWGTRFSNREWNLTQEIYMMFPASDVAEQYTLAQSLKLKEAENVRCWGRSARTGRASQQKSKYSARMQHSSVSS